MKKMYCPKCNKKLVQERNKRFETSLEHVCNPNQQDYPLRPIWECKNPKCDCCKKEIFWNESGECYGGFDIEFPNDIHSAYPSFSRRMETEIYKKDVKSKIYLHPFLMLWFLQPMIEFTYEADEYGKILSKGWKLNWLKKDSLNPFKKDRFGYHTYYTFPFINIVLFLKSKNNQIKNIKENGETNFTMLHLKESFKDIASWDKRWWRHFELWLSKIIFRKWYLKSLTYEKPKRY